MQWKTARIVAEWNQLPAQNKKLYTILSLADKFSQQEFNKELFITCILRTEAENAELYKDSVEPDWRPHTLWMGADLRSSIYTDAEIQKLLSFFNLFTVFSGQRRCASYHIIPGNVFHFHVQASRD